MDAGNARRGRSGACRDPRRACGSPAPTSLLPASRRRSTRRPRRSATPRRELGVELARTPARVAGEDARARRRRLDQPAQQQRRRREVDARRRPTPPRSRPARCPSGSSRAAARPDRPPQRQPAVASTAAAAAAPPGSRWSSVGRLIDEPEGAVGVVLAQQHDRPVEVRDRPAAAWTGGAPARCRAARRWPMPSLYACAAAHPSQRRAAARRSPRRRTGAPSEGRAVSRATSSSAATRLAHRLRVAERDREIAAQARQGARVMALPVSAAGSSASDSAADRRAAARQGRPRLPLRIGRDQRRLVPRTDVLADVAAVDVAPDGVGDARRDRAFAARSSGRTGSASRRARTARRWRRSDTRRGTACTCRTDRAPARSASSGRLQRSSPGRSTTRARR